VILRTASPGVADTPIRPEAMAAWSMGDFERGVELCGVEGSSRSQYYA
jgi:hypothetical protein